MTRWLDPKPTEHTNLTSIGISPLLEQILARRGITDPAAARAFLDPTSVAPVPFPGIELAVERLRTAAFRGERICVWGDFDVDGQTSTTLLVQVLRALGANASYYVPTRDKGGHGVHLAALKEIVERGAQLVVTCDTGISAHEPAAYARAHGVEFIITDHHDPEDTLPDASAVIDPKMLPADHALAGLAGVGVAYKVVEPLLSLLSPGAAPVLDLVGLGLIADVARLRFETRTLAFRGIQALRQSRRMGLRLLAEQADADLSTLTEETIGFGLAPRLNAVGRLGDANTAVELLLSDDPVRARVLAAQLEGLNTQRKLLTDQVFDAVEEQLAANPTLLSRPILILTHPSWPGGVLGIVAARLVERFRKPALLLSSDDQGTLRGSARSIDGVHITQAIAANRQFVDTFGGHPMAAGLSLSPAKLPEFQRALERSVETQLETSHIEEDSILIERWLTLDELTIELADDLEKLAPFGVGNPTPILASRSLQLKSSRYLGPSKEHRRLALADDQGRVQDVHWWNSREDPLPEGKFDLAFSIRARAFRGERRLTVELRDFRALQSAITITTRSLEIFDWRRVPSRPALPSPCLIWAEGPDGSKGVNRYSLRPLDALAIITPPPSRSDLLAALNRVRPKSVYLLPGGSPPAATAEEFLTHLARLAKYALGSGYGKTRISALTAACAQRELAVQLGLQWLAAAGHLSVQVTGDDVQLRSTEAQANLLARRELYAALRSIIEETLAYRSYFANADPDLLFKN